MKAAVLPLLHERRPPLPPPAPDLMNSESPRDFRRNFKAGIRLAVPACGELIRRRPS